MPVRDNPSHTHVTDDKDVAPALRRLIAEDAVGQLRRREGRMARLGSEDGVLKLDWVEGVARLLADDNALAQVEMEARDIWRQGVRHVIWAGMGGSVITVHVLVDLGLCRGDEGEDAVTIYPLDSTDPAALNSIVRRIAAAKNVALPPDDAREPAAAPLLHELLHDVLMVGVSMGMTSEEPITHLEWFTALLNSARLDPAEHVLVMTLPNSYLDRFAQQHGAPRRPLQLDGGTGTGGRMSAPATRVFLLPAALSLIGAAPETGRLRQVLTRAWATYDLALATDDPAAHPFVRLASALSAASRDGACRLLLDLPRPWRPLLAWIEQLMEESLGKDGKGIVVFDDQPLNPRAPGYRTDGTLRVRVTSGADTPSDTDDGLFVLAQPIMTDSADPGDRLAAVAASFLDWQLCMALFGYLHDITFAGQPAVENYKARARVLRAQDAPLHIAQEQNHSVTAGALTLLTLPGQATGPSGDTPAACIAAALQGSLAATDDWRLGYFDLTMNGELPAGWAPLLHDALQSLGPTTLGVPARLRRAPAAYHSTEQGEMDGPPYLVSVRLVTRGHEESVLGAYTDTFLQAQAVGTWQAMTEQGRACFLLIVDGADDASVEALGQLFAAVERRLESSGVASTNRAVGA